MRPSRIEESAGRPGDARDMESTLQTTQPIRLAFNGSALLSPLTGVGQYSNSLARSLMETGELDVEFFYAAIWSREIRTKPVKEIGVLKELIKKLVPQPYRVSRALQGWRFGMGTRRFRPQIYHEPNFLPFKFDGTDGHHRARSVLDQVSGDPSRRARRGDERVVPQGA